MFLKNKRYLFLSLAFLAIFGQKSAAFVVVPPSQGLTKGFAITSTNDTLTGYFGLMEHSYVVYAAEKRGKKQEFKPDHFKTVYLELKSDKVFNENGLMEFDYLKQCNGLYRKIYQGKNSIYYDQNATYYATDRIFDVRIKELTSDSVTIVPSGFKSTQKTLIDYLNKNYHTAFGYKDFSNSIEVIREIDKHM